MDYSIYISFYRAVVTLVLISVEQFSHFNQKIYTKKNYTQ